MILNSMDTQFKLHDDGQISWQRDLTNPMPGDVVAQIVKGDSILAPKCSLVSTDVTKDEDQVALLAFVQTWLGAHIKQALEPLFNMQSEDIPTGAPRKITDTLFNALGVVQRSDIQSDIGQMDEDQRSALRTKKIRFGPLLVYLPELNKPVTVKLRALLLTLWQDKDLPADAPADGIVSFSVEGKELDKAYYQSIGYPIYGPRSVRVDMLDRVICTVYDTAKEGKFMAQHQMAEWLGSNIADLYLILEAMGHKKIHDPADVVKEEVEAVVAEEKPAVEEITEEKTDVKPEAVIVAKPELATFALKKGKAIETPSSFTAKPNNKLKNTNFKSDKKAPKKPYKKKGPPKDQGQRVFKAEAKSNPEDNPFAILQQLKSKD